MTFYMPTRVFVDEDCVAKNKSELSKLGTKALIVTGTKSSAINGSLKDVITALEGLGLTYVIFNKVEENPSVDTVMESAKLGIENNCDFVIGIGGGSPIDAAKAAAIIIKNKYDSYELLYDKTASGDAVPVVAVPTTCGTGSETTGVSVLTVPAKRTKLSVVHKVFPKLSFVDGKYLEYASVDIIKNTAVDALSHLWESYLTVSTSVYSRMLVETGLILWSKSKDIILGNRKPEKSDYKNMMNAATLAGMAIAQTGTTIPHSLSYSITYEDKVSHGEAVGMFLSGFINEADEADREFLLNTSGFDSLEEFDDFFDTLYGRRVLSEEMKTRVVDEVYARKEKLAMCPFRVDYDTLIRIVNYR